MRFAEAPAAGRSILATSRQTPGARAYRMLARRLAGFADLPDARVGADDMIDLVETSSVGP